MLKKCEICGKQFDMITRKRFCADCKRQLYNTYNAYWMRNKYSPQKEQIRHTPEYLAQIKEKYRNGVSKKMIEDWIYSL